MLSKQTGYLCLLLSASGCATAAGNASYPSLRTDYDRAAAESHAAPSARAGASTGAAASDAGRSTRGSVLERAPFVQAVLRSNPTIESSRQAWRAALALVDEACTFEDPMVDLGIAPLSVGSSEARVGYELAISQKLPWFGKRSLEASLAAAEAEATRSDFEAARRELALTAVTLYDQYFVATRSLEINAEHVELLRAFRSAAIAAYEAGRASAQDPLQAEAELAHLEHASAVLASQKDVVAAEMNELLHRAPDAPLPPPPRELVLPMPPDAASRGHLETRAVETRPDIVAVRQRAHAEQVRADKAERDYYPDFTVSTSYNSMWDMWQHRWMVGLGLNLPIQTGGRAGMVEEAHARRAQLESDASRMEDAARTQVFVALRRTSESKHVLELFEQRLLPVARDQVEAARAGFTASRNPFMAVIEAERNLRNVELDYQMARAECDRRHAELERAFGGIPGLEQQENHR